METDISALDLLPSRNAELAAEDHGHRSCVVGRGGSVITASNMADTGATSTCVTLR